MTSRAFKVTALLGILFLFHPALSYAKVVKTVPYTKCDNVTPVNTLSGSTGGSPGTINKIPSVDFSCCGSCNASCPGGSGAACGTHTGTDSCGTACSVDCGSCTSPKTCNASSNGTCIDLCADGVQNQGETGVDCGGPCGACACVPACNGFDCSPGGVRVYGVQSYSDSCGNANACGFDCGCFPDGHACAGALQIPEANGSATGCCSGLCMYGTCTSCYPNNVPCHPGTAGHGCCSGCCSSVTGDCRPWSSTACGGTGT